MQVDHQYQCKKQIQFLKYFFEFHIRNKTQGHIKSNISTKKHIIKWNIEINIQNQK